MYSAYNSEGATLVISLYLWVAPISVAGHSRFPIKATTACVVCVAVAPPPYHVSILSVAYFGCGFSAAGKIYPAP